MYRLNLEHKQGDEINSPTNEQILKANRKTRNMGSTSSSCKVSHKWLAKKKKKEQLLLIEQTTETMPLAPKPIPAAVTDDQ